MERISYQKKLERARNFTKNIFYVLSLIVSIGLGYYMGIHSDKFKTQVVEKKLEVIDRKNISFGLDERNNLIIINKNIGSCVVYEDSVGYEIFNLYAKKIIN